MTAASEWPKALPDAVLAFLYDILYTNLGCKSTGLKVMFNFSFYEKNGFISNSELYNKNRKTISMRKDLYR
jgi:hypothetical protein